MHILYYHGIIHRIKACYKKGEECIKSDCETIVQYLNEPNDSMLSNRL